MENKEFTETANPETEIKVEMPKMNRAALRNFSKRLSHANSKYAQIANDIKMKKQVHEARKRHRKPSNYEA